MSSVVPHHLNVADLLQQEIPACLLVKIGDLKFSAVVATGYSSSLITENAYNKIQELSNKASVIVKEFNKTKICDRGDASKKFECVHLNAFISDEPVSLQLTITPKLLYDLVLGCDFIKNVQGGFHFEIQAFKWRFNDKINITNFLSKEEFLRLKSVSPSNANPSMPMNSNEGKLKDHMSKKPSLKALENTNPLNEDSSINPSSPKKTKFSKDQSNNEKTKSLEKNSESKDGTFLDKKPTKKSSELHEKENCLYKNWKTVHVMMKVMHNLLGGRPLVFNGIFWSKGSKHNLVYQENLDDKTLFGCYLFAIAKVIQTAVDNKWSHLLVYLNDDSMADTLNMSYMRRESPSRKNYSEFTKTEFKALQFICSQFEAISPVKFEFVPFEDLHTSKMGLLEKMIDARFFSL